jgi:hypothetical protein
LVKLVGKSGVMKMPKAAAKDCQFTPADFGLEKMEPPGFTCPDCGGAVVQIQNGRNTQFRCHIGHRFSFDSFTDAQSEALERAIWVAIRRLNEQRAFQETFAQRVTDNPSLKNRYLENAAAADHDMKQLHSILRRL